MASFVAERALPNLEVVDLSRMRTEELKSLWEREVRLWRDKVDWDVAGAITALDAKSGEILWRRKNIYSWSPMASDGEVLACPMWSSKDDQLYLIDCATGETLWATERADNHYNPPITLTSDLVLYQPSDFF